MTDTKNETPERIWVNLDASEDGCCPIAEDISIENIPDRGRFFHLPTATEYVRADLLADMTRQRDELAAEVVRLLHAQTLDAIQSGINEARAEGAKP